MLVDPIQTAVTSTTRALRGCGYVSGLFSITNPGSRRTSSISLSQSQYWDWVGFRLTLTMYPPHLTMKGSRHATPPKRLCDSSEKLRCDV
jgi:hypothetical protein